MSEFWYLATPYSKYAGGIYDAFLLAVHTRGFLLKANIPCFSPIIHSHSVAMECDLDPYDHTIWLPSEAPLMAAAFGLIVVMADGWQESYGIGEEITAFVASHRPIIYMHPQTVPQELLEWRLNFPR